MEFINYAIDLGTTNSLIAKNENGFVKVFKNPKGFHETLPSVVAFRKSGILIGEKAKEFKDRDPKMLSPLSKERWELMQAILLKN